MIPHGERCFCDGCIKDRTKAKIEARNRTKDADAYVKRRGGLDRPPNSKLNRSKE